MITKDKTQELTEREKLLRKYYLECFIVEISKVIIFLFVFLLMGLTSEYLIALAALILLRTNGGGLHFNHYMSCLIGSFVLLYASIFLAFTIVPSNFIMCISLILCIISAYFLVPITSSNRLPATAEQIKRSKKNTTIIISLFLILICICPHRAWHNICYWTIILHILQLFAARLMKGGE